MDIQKTLKNVKDRGMDASYFKTAKEAADYLIGEISDTTVGIGGSRTIDSLNIYDELCKTNDVAWHWKSGFNNADTFAKAAAAEVYLSSANAISETGEIVNIDGRCNRIAALSFAEGKRIYIVASTKKVCPDLNSAIERARQIAAPLNVKKLPGDRPCNETAKCFDCRSAARGCCVMQIVMFKPMNAVKYELILVDEDLGL
jgi:Uncharacterised ACR, YkgG family COG1556.